MRWLGAFLVDAATIIGIIVGATAILAGLWKLGRRTVGRRWDHYRRLRRLRVNAQVDYFTSVLGRSPAIRRSVRHTVRVFKEPSGAMVDEEHDFQECIYVDPLYFVDALVDDDETVLAFAVTTRSKAFRPRFASAAKGAVPRLVVRLGKTRFAELPEIPWRLLANLGARRFSYGEVFYLGNPGNYLTFVCSVCDAGLMDWDGPLPVDTEAGEWDFDLPTYPLDGNEELLLRPRIKAYREHATINTWAVVGGPFDPANDPQPVRMIFGADYDHVRTVAA